jgi:hypothetical protein
MEIVQNIRAKINTKIKTMSDSIKKYYEMMEGKSIFESPDKGNTISKRPFGGDPLDRELIKKTSERVEDEWLETFAKVARHYPTASAKLLRQLTDDEIYVKKVCD